MIFEEELSKEMDGKECSHSRVNGNGGMLVLAEAVSGEPADNDSKSLSLEETGAAQELLALASEASLSSPINRNDLQTPFDEKENEVDPSVADLINSAAASTNNGRKHVCNNCGATSTPFWRKSPDGLYYCNACGLYLRTHNSMRPLSLSKNRETRRSKMRPEACGNCGATDTPMWRKTEDGLMVCNACGLYHKLHGQHRKLGARRSSSKSVNTGNSSPKKPQPSSRSTEFTIVKENAHVANNNLERPVPNSTATLKYSLDAQFHHKFDPNRSTFSSKNTSEIATPMPIPSMTTFPLPQVQPVDPRKLAYLKSSQGRTALLAPKLSPIDIQPVPVYNQSNQIPNQMSNPYVPSSSVTPPILTNFINSLASTPAELLTNDQVDHPLQPLLTSIVSQKLKEQRRRAYSKSTSPDSVMMSMADWAAANSAGISDNNQLQLNQFMQNQQDAIYNGYNNGHNGHNGGYNTYENSANYNHSNSSNTDYDNINYPVPNPYYQQQQQQAYYQAQAIPYQYQNAQYPQYHPAPQQHQHYNPHHPQYNPQQQEQHNNSQFQPDNQQQQSTYYNSDFVGEVPTRQLSPFSGIKFDKNLIDLVNMQFWQEPSNTANPSNPETTTSSIDDVIQDMPNPSIS